MPNSTTRLVDAMMKARLGISAAPFLNRVRLTDAEA